jgi:hypothetical protein
LSLAIFYVTISLGHQVYMWVNNILVVVTYLFRVYVQHFGPYIKEDELWKEEEEGKEGEKGNEREEEDGYGFGGEGLMISIWVIDKAPLESTWKIMTKTTKDKFVLCFPNK